MKLDPGFTNHWKTEKLISELGADGVVAVLRLWGNAQIRREYSGLNLTPKRLAMETKWKGDASHLFAVLTDRDAPWLDLDDDGTISIHGFAEHQHQVVKLWENGKKGGRPKKVSLTLSSKDSSSSSSSSSSPICEPNGNQMVLKLAESILAAYPRKVARKPALQAITKALKKNTVDYLLERTTAYAAAVAGKEQQFIPHPTTWFNQERFNDDPQEWEPTANTNQPTEPGTATIGGRKYTP